MTETAQRKPAYRRWWFWLMVLGLVYLVTGFGLIPLYLSSAIPDRLQQNLGWTVETGDVGFNPFTFAFSVDDLTATDESGQRVLEADEVVLNLGLMDLARGTVHVELLELTDPFLRVDLLDGHRLSLIEDWNAHQDDEADSSWLSDVVFEEALVNGGRVRFRDVSGGGERESREIVIDSLGATMSDVATHESDEPGQYTVNAVMDGQVLEWSGTLSLSPLWSNGSVSLGNVSADTLQKWFGHHLPWSLSDGRLSLNTDFQFAYDDQGVALATRQGQVSASRLALADPQQPDAILANVGSLTLEGVAFTLQGPELLVSRVQGEAVHLNAVMDKDGQLNLTHSLEEMAEGSEEATTLRWSVGNLSIGKSSIEWQDNRPATPVTATLQEVELTLGAMTEQLEAPITYQARAVLGQGGTASANGQFTLRPLTFEGGVNLDQLALAPFNGYLQQTSQLEVQDGTLNLAGNIDIDVQDDPLTGTFSGRGSISHFSGRFPDEDEPVMVWRELRLDPIEYNFAPARLEIGTMTMSEPELNVINYRDRAHNVTRLIEPVSAASPESGSDDEGLIFRLGQLELSNGEIRYTDQMPEPVFRGRVHELEASASGISNITPEQGQFTVKGMVNDTGDLRADGTIAPLGTEEPSTIEATLKGLSMPVISPYFAYYLGYRVEGGKLSSDGSYTLRGTELESTTRLTLERLELGEAVQSKQSVNAPVKLGLTLLRDDDGQVSVDVPVSGDLADPQFDFGPVMMQSLRSLLVKAAMSPFNLLGSVVDLAGFSGEELGSVAFLPGETSLVMGEYTKMEAVAKAIKAREGLVLTIRGRALESVDLPVLEQGLEEDETLQEGVLEVLARQRGETLKSLLEEEYDVPGDQIVLQAPQVDQGEGSADQVAIEFQLEAR